MTTKEAVDNLQMLLERPDVNKEERESLTIAIRELDRKYTSEPPKVPGFYWFRSRPHYCIYEVLDIVGRGLEVMGRPVTAMGGEWCGPLTPPELSNSPNSLASG